jgi:methyltransferase (TIGR00027 family)
MKDQTYSRTAESMAIVRAIEYTARPPAGRILSDPWAARFIQNKFMRTTLRFPLLTRALSSISAFWLPGAQEYVLVRARLVDDLSAQLAEQDLEQLAILGAGFDTTIFRLQDKLRRIQVFEVDHPATQAVKTAVLSNMTLPSNVRFIPVDFEKDDFVERLISSGFKPGRRSLITWLGVSYYLTSQAAATTLSQIAALCSPGSHLIFDYVLESVIAGTATSRAARAGIKHAARLGEPFHFGMDPDRISAYLSNLGFRLVRQYDWLQLQSRYCTPDRAPVDFTRIAVCQRINSRPSHRDAPGSHQSHHRGLIRN